MLLRRRCVGFRHLGVVLLGGARVRLVVFLPVVGGLALASVVVVGVGGIGVVVVGVVVAVVPVHALLAVVGVYPALGNAVRLLLLLLLLLLQVGSGVLRIEVALLARRPVLVVERHVDITEGLSRAGGALHEAVLLRLTLGANGCGGLGRLALALCRRGGGVRAAVDGGAAGEGGRVFFCLDWGGGFLLGLSGLGLGSGSGGRCGFSFLGFGSEMLRQNCGGGGWEGLKSGTNTGG